MSCIIILYSYIYFFKQEGGVGAMSPSSLKVTHNMEEEVTIS